MRQQLASLGHSVAGSHRPKAGTRPPSLRSIGKFCGFRIAALAVI